MSARVMRFSFPMPPRLNTNTYRGHWSQAYRAKKRFNSDCDARQQLGLLPPPPREPFKRVVMHATLYLARQMDHDNAFHRASKLPLDWLKTRGYIVDDSPKVVDWSGIPEQRTQSGNPQRVEIVLTELTYV